MQCVIIDDTSFAELPLMNYINRLAADHHGSVASVCLSCFGAGTRSKQSLIVI